MSTQPEEKWFELVAFFKPEEGKEVKHKGQRIFICGDVNEVKVLQITEVYGNEAKTMARLKGAYEIMKKMEIDKGIVVTDSVKFVKLQEVVDPETLERLHANQKMVH